ncbi:3-hydroxyacyl-CoA dehydrogenase [Brevundimonas sp.]|uniref:3-hydroxyacyl-CoA dehydrogenase n=1 Tax=Brevundimonas sp. TaxID=1871086 RepID=UPI002635FB70|nr:3-hydroxyacyl-CoA dehydrogenase [Brevundimonas sp.]
MGAGAMGSGIASVAAQAGFAVKLYDRVPGAARAGLIGLASDLARQVKKGRLTADEARKIQEGLQAVESLEEFADCSLVLEAIAEKLEAKVDLFCALDDIVSADAILATNTSSLSIDAIAAPTRWPGRVVGMHFFNPPVAMRLVEVVSGAMAEPIVADRVFELAAAWGKSPVRCSSTPGFIVNRVARPFYGEALKLLEARACAPEVIDTVVKQGGGFRMGPVELMDFIGHDVNFAVTRSVFEAFFQDPRYRPSLVQKALVDAGRLGRKSGVGFYTYLDGQPTTVVPEQAWPAPGIVRLGRDATSGLATRFRNSELEVIEADGSDGLRIGGVLILETDGRTALQREIETGEAVVVVDLVMDERTAAARSAATSPGVSRMQRDAIGAAFAALGQTIHYIDDVPGLVLGRTLAMIANEAADALQQGVASASDIDSAMVKGANYPFGPLAWSESLGPSRLVSILDALSLDSPDGRYRASPLLRRAALTGASLAPV